MERRLVRTLSFWFLILFGLGLVAWGVSRVQSPSCKAADGLRNSGLLNQSKEAYLEILKSDPNSECGTRGLRMTIDQSCKAFVNQTDDDLKAAILGSELKDFVETCQEPALAAPPKRTALRATLDWVAGIFRGDPPQPGPLEWVLLVLGVGLLIRQVRLFALRRRPGPIDVVELVDATGLDKLQPKSLTARLRERLGATGVLPPAAVPGGQFQQSIADVVTSSPLGQATWIGKIIQFFTQTVWAKTGHKVTGTLRVGTYDPRFAVTIEVSDVASGGPERVATFWGENHADSVRDAAFFIYQLVMSHPDVAAGVPLWQRWNSPLGKGASFFHGGLWEETRGDAKKAITAYTNAVQLEPRNALARLRLAAQLERNAQFLDALEQYLCVALLWPRLRLPRYRLAATYAAHQLLVMQWEETSHKQRERLENLINRLEKAKLPREGELHGYFLDRAIDAWEGLDRWIPDKRTEQLRSYHFHMAVRVAGAVTRLQRALLPSPQAAAPGGGLAPHANDVMWSYQEGLKVLKRALRWWPGWKASYNAACFHSWATQVREEEGWPGHCAEQAVAELKNVLRNPRAELDLGWLWVDPDLENLRQLPSFCAWLTAVAGEEESKAKPEARSELRSLYFAWDVLADWASRVAAGWKERLDEIGTWSGVQFQELQRWCEEERELWRSLGHWATELGDERRRKDFWAAITKAAGSGDASKEEVPSPHLSSDEGDKDSVQAAIAAHRGAWSMLQSQADKTRDCWTERRERAEADGIFRTVSLQSCLDWAHGAQYSWQALKDWAEGPTHIDAEQDFKDSLSWCR